VEVSTREEHVAEFMERDAHDAIRKVEGVLHTVAVMDIDINIQYLYQKETSKIK
jgi:hypothetical protein